MLPSHFTIEKQDVIAGGYGVDAGLSDVDVLHEDYLHTRHILRATCRLHAGRRFRTVRGRRWTVRRRRPATIRECRLHVDRKIRLV